MSYLRRRQGCGGTVFTRSWHLAVPVLVVIAICSGASVASAANVNIVRQGEPPEKVPAKTHYYTTIQAAVNASKRGDWVLIEPGKYNEPVWVYAEQSGIKIRGMDRNSVIVDGQHEPGPEGKNGIEIFKANKVSVENLTVRNFDRASLNGPNGNEIWFNGGGGSGKIGARRWTGRYLTAYDTGLNGGYGLFTSNETEGSFEHIYASGFDDSGLYIGACRNCRARVFDAVMENNALGYSGSNSGGQLLIENSVFSRNSAGLAPNSENPGDPPPPQDGACNSGSNRSVTPKFKSTEIERCTIFRNNVIEENNNLSTPANHSTAASPWGVGVELPGVYADLVEGNTIRNNANNGLLGFEFPNPFPPQENTIFFQLAGNRISDNTFSGNGTLGGAFAGDVSLEGGFFGQKKSTNNCLSGNTFTAATFPAKIEETWGCQNSTTPNPGEPESIAYILELQAESEARSPVPQPAPPPQPTMPNPCQGVPYNPLCQ
jgi:hypothetical protein